MPVAVAALARLGVALPARSAPFTGIRYVAAGEVAEADFPGGALGRGVRRTAAPRRARRRRRGGRASSSVWGRAATGLLPGGVATADGAVAARFVVGADGLRSQVRAWAGLAAARRAPRRFGVVRHFRRAPWSGRVEVTFGDGVEAYVTPLAYAPTAARSASPCSGAATATASTRSSRGACRPRSRGASRARPCSAATAAPARSTSARAAPCAAAWRSSATPPATSTR